jgi:hypothetical protein
VRVRLKGRATLASALKIHFSTGYPPFASRVWCMRYRGRTNEALTLLISMKTQSFITTGLVGSDCGAYPLRQDRAGSA